MNLKEYLSRNLWIFLIITACSSCGCDKEAPSVDENSEHSLYFHIHSLTRASGYSSNELIRSLRIMMFSEGVLERNEYVSFENLDKSAEFFDYAFLWQTKPGHKDFYIFANEESVPSITVPQGSLPEGLESIESLSDFLSYFQPSQSSSEEVSSVDKSLFLELIDKVYFTPNYDNVDGTIYLPYSASYTGQFGIDIDKAGTHTELKNPLYLVPVATKFQFNFINLTNQDIDVTGLSLSNINSQNFLLANVGNKDRVKNFGPVNDLAYEPSDENKGLYWIYWLAKIAEESWNNPLYSDNFNFNEKYGWIYDYNLPDSNVTIFDFIPQNSSPWVVEPSVDDNDPFIFSSDIYYLPESKNLVDNTQAYSIILRCSKGGENKNIELSIGNLRSLFRDTCVKITFTISDGDIEIYAEIADWIQKTANGILREDR